MKKLIIAGMFAAGMLVTPMLATGAEASGATNAQVNPCASFMGGFASSSTYEGAGLGTGGNPFAPTPYGQVVQSFAQTTLGVC
jgi:hypothetical protein